ncbi:MAG TPA: CBS domain-containing protein [Polyangia bacterium]|nr:CBS domain-containing protein [Polyangia bacterium]
MGSVNDIGKFSEGGRGLPLALSRPQGALPYSPLVRQAFAPTPLARIGWGQGLTTVGDVMLEPPTCALSPDDSLRDAARQMLRDEAGFVPVCAGGRFVGVVYEDAVLQSVADDRTVPNLAKVLSTQIPTCMRQSTLVDAVRQMIACYLRKIPVVGDAGELVGILTLSEAAAAALRDPAVGDVIERFAGSPSLFARRMR